MQGSMLFYSVFENEELILGVAGCALNHQLST